jgi:hypothetical protein
MIHPTLSPRRQRHRPVGRALLIDHRRYFRLIPTRFPEQPVVEIRQAVLGDRATVNDIKSHADDARIAGRKGNKFAA